MQKNLTLMDVKINERDYPDEVFTERSNYNRNINR